MAKNNRIKEESPKNAISSNPESGRASADVDSKKRVVFVSGVIDEAKASNFIRNVFSLEMQSPSEDIVVVIDSFGGWTDSLFAMCDVMNMVTCKIHTICIGKAMSCGQILLINAPKGNRYITPNSRIMMHEISSFVHGKFSTIENETKEMFRIQKQVEQMILNKTKLNKSQLEKMLKENCYMSAKDAVKYGFADKIINKFSDLKIKNW